MGTFEAVWLWLWFAASAMSALMQVGLVGACLCWGAKEAKAARWTAASLASLAAALFLHAAVALWTVARLRLSHGR